jgi:hypothetical protein
MSWCTPLAATFRRHSGQTPGCAGSSFRNLDWFRKPFGPSCLCLYQGGAAFALGLRPIMELPTRSPKNFFRSILPPETIADRPLPAFPVSAAAGGSAPRLPR